MIKESRTGITRLQIILVVLLTIFYFSYMLIPNPDQMTEVRGVYYGSYIWPVGIFLFRLLGSFGWVIFGTGMAVWFWYSLPIYILLQEILNIQIPFTASPALNGEYPLAWWGWLFMGFLVVLYNFLLTLAIPHLKSVFRFFFKSAEHMSFKQSDDVLGFKDMKQRGFQES